MRYLLLSLLLTGCSGGSSYSESVESTEPEKPVTGIWYGDSRCSANPYLDSKQCIPGKAMPQMEPLDFSYDRIVIHLGVNSMPWHDVHIWAYHLDDLIKPNPDKVWCVLPAWFNPTVSIQIISDFREAMLAICTHTVDPQIQPYGPDGIHYTDSNYRQVRDVYLDIMDQ